LGQITTTSGLELWGQRLLAAILLGGQVTLHLLKFKIHRCNTLDQMVAVGPESLLIVLLTASFVGMVFTIQTDLI
jgi:phospholipid/cholesterol/gamma-HCH transport system permease protein